MRPTTLTALMALLFALQPAASLPAASPGAPAAKLKTRIIDTLEPYSEAWLKQAIVDFVAESKTIAANAVAGNDVAATSDGSFQCPAPTFKCKAYPDDGVAPVNASTVRPKDIQTILAIGDSITAGFGIDSQRLPFTQIKEFRGLTFGIGCDEGATTIANFLETYRPSIRGASLGTTPLRATGSVLNAAYSGSKIADVIPQIDILKQAYSDGSYAPDGWKVVQFLIGANDLCWSCRQDPPPTTPDLFEERYRNTIRYLQSAFPTKTIVNAFQVFNVSQTWAPQRGSLYCKVTQGILNLCRCDDTAENRARMDAYAVEYNKRVEKVAAEFQSKDFVVNVQPAMSNLVINSLDYLSRLDCFHPNRCAHSIVAGMLWNNMFQPQGQKVNNYQFTSFNEIYCPGPTISSDPASQLPCIVNDDVHPVRICSPSFVGVIYVRIRDYPVNQDAEEQTPVTNHNDADSAHDRTRQGSFSSVATAINAPKGGGGITDYFKPHFARRFSIQVEGRFQREVAPEKVLWGAFFEKPIKLPLGHSLAFGVAKLIDPGLVGRFNIKQPWMCGFEFYSPHVDFNTFRLSLGPVHVGIEPFIGDQDIVFAAKSLPASEDEGEPEVFFFVRFSRAEA
ncbi:hypothetical protein HDU96_009905 [Phlyctochytrium bullatum]|nr:hypothetical protein HDU96_009905 [Phlyctochytrium bullatum]